MACLDHRHDLLIREYFFYSIFKGAGLAMNNPLLQEQIN